jgi:hypothetical protein
MVGRVSTGGWVYSYAFPYACIETGGQNHMVLVNPVVTLNAELTRAQVLIRCRKVADGRCESMMRGRGERRLICDCLCMHNAQEWHLTGYPVGKDLLGLLSLCFLPLPIESVVASVHSSRLRHQFFRR